ncbi:hypothetical protein CKAN_02577500 [Cinnamomum micranthum f. kanehirae]|uniref:Uncharacterized protein n=1 Tax=Cinnamomum micranthum f. kanehirae TaxID=337451 RepID=A0A443Q043_9MAGN|nr:hypothetical protein CKAN_02577500 [Cinnamomum micranthum f. kanehirae]
MAFLKSPPASPSSSLRLPSLLPRRSSLPRNLLFFPKFNPPFKSLSNSTISFPLLSPPNALPTTDQEILEAILQSDDKRIGNLPGVRIFENDLARLNVIGDVSSEQAITAAAADGGDAAEEHLASGMSAMVIETVFPVGPDEHSTISTRLFLPARKVKEKAKKLQSMLNADFLSSTTSRNILAMTFRQVVLHHFWSFELLLFSPGSERNMEDLVNPREGSFCACRSCLPVCSREYRERFLVNSKGISSRDVFPWFQKPKRIASSDSSVNIYKISQDQIVESAKNSVEDFNSVKGKYMGSEIKQKDRWWASPTYSRLDKIGGPEFSSWTNEYMPAYRLQVNAENFQNVKFEGWQRSVDNRWEVLLTHSQMVGLANILDMYYEDQYTNPGRQLLSGFTADFSKLSKSKSSLWKMISIGVVGGCVLLSISFLAQLCWPRLFKPPVSPKEHFTISSSDVDYSSQPFLEAAELEALCILVVKKIKDAFGFPGDIMTDPDVGAWIGQLPSYLTRKRDVNLIQDVNSSTNRSSGDVPTHEDLSDTAPSSSLESNTDSEMTTAQDIASFQVVLSRDGKLIGFQPMSRLAVNYWASNPLAKALHGGRKISPGILEPSLKIPRPDEAIQLELLMSVNPKSWFALARPVR